MDSKNNIIIVKQNNQLFIKELKDMANELARSKKNYDIPYIILLLREAAKRLAN